MNNIYRKTKFEISCANKSQFPKNSICEIAFAGRSNAGKSSALNALTEQKNLAKVSKTPGRTQLINYFSIPYENCYLVDLPGYGYAKVPNEIKNNWYKLLGNYILDREQLCGVVLLMDIRHYLKDIDIQLLECCAQRNIPVHILLTKADKLSKSQIIKAINDVKSYIVNWDVAISLQEFSSLKKIKLNELIEQLDHWFAEFIN